jgi:hypothetical protein
MFESVFIDLDDSIKSLEEEKIFIKNLKCLVDQGQCYEAFLQVEDKIECYIDQDPSAQRWVLLSEDTIPDSVEAARDELINIGNVEILDHLVEKALQNISLDKYIHVDFSVSSKSRIRKTIQEIIEKKLGKKVTENMRENPLAKISFTIQSIS